MKWRCVGICLLASIVASATPAPRTAYACCTMVEHGRHVGIADQEILVVWDEARHLEHFVRRATFESSAARGFGFLVPTPTKPTLAEARDEVFDALASASRPVPKRRYQTDFMPLILYPFLLTRMGAQPEAPVAAAIHVLDRQKVAGYDAVVLEADDASALAHWLRDNGYEARPEIEEWARPYVAAHWKFTAFEYAQEGPADRDGLSPAAATSEVRTKAVRISFATDRPLFPYRVPADLRAKPHAAHRLRVYFVGDSRFEGALGADASRWAGVARYSAPVDGLAGMLASVEAPESLASLRWLTVFEDRTWPGGSEDLFFSRSTSASALVPTFDVWVPIPLPLDLLALAGFVVFRTRKRREHGAG